MSQSIKLTDEHIALLIKIGSGLRNHPDWDHVSSDERYLFIDLNDLGLYRVRGGAREPISRTLTREGRQAIETYERTHNGRDGKDES